MNAHVSFRYLMNETPLLDNRLLILEDDKAIAEMLLGQAEDRGLIGFIASNKEKFRETFLRLKPSVLILDIVLGDEDVNPVIDFLGGEGCKCPVFFLTGYNHELLFKVSEKARSSGLMVVGAFEKKGEGVARLMQKIEKYILR